MITTISFANSQWCHLVESLQQDGRERVAFVLCGRHRGSDRHRLLPQEVHPLPDSAYHTRRADGVHWSTASLEPLLDRAAKGGLALLKVHTHPGGFAAFSSADDRADGALFPSVHGWVDDGYPHASAILLPGGRIIARVFEAGGQCTPVSHVQVAGDALQLWLPPSDSAGDAEDEAATRNIQAFGEGTHRIMRRLRVAVVGTSGTGSIVAELLARLLAGEIVLVDPDHIEPCNLNRIIGSTRADVGRFKTEVLADRIETMGLGVRAISIPRELSDPAALAAVASADAVFGCVDSIDGRHLLNRLATYYTQPYFDVGVRLDADGYGGVSECVGSVHYVQPGRSSLLSRGVYTAEQLRAASLQSYDPIAYAALRAEKYIVGADEHRPAVAPVNMFFASRAVLEFLARVHPYRLGDPAEAWWTESLASSIVLGNPEANEPVDAALLAHVGAGDLEPPLGLPFLGSA